jgi:hypothetical protein
MSSGSSSCCRGHPLVPMDFGVVIVFVHGISLVLLLTSSAICGNFGPLDSPGLCFFLSVLFLDLLLLEPMKQQWGSRKGDLPS